MKQKDFQNETWAALSSATINNDLEQIASILSKDNITQRYLGRALLIASDYGYLQAVNLLIKAGAEVNYTSGDGSTALTNAVHEGQTEVARALLSAGADTSIPEYAEVSPPLMIAASKGSLEIVKLLVETGADVNQIAQSSGDYALASAAGAGYEDIFNYLLPLTNLELRKEAEKILRLGIRERELEENADPLVVELTNAVMEQDIAKIKQIITLGVNLNGLNCVGSTALFFAVTGNNYTIVKMLLEEGASPNLVGDENEDKTPLMRARTGDICSILIKFGADINAHNINGITALMISTYALYDIETMQLLLAAGANVNAKNKKGMTPLMYASSDYEHFKSWKLTRIEKVKLLLDTEANINEKDNQGNTALSLAKQSGHTEIVQLLLNAGATED